MPALSREIGTSSQKDNSEIKLSRALPLLKRHSQNAYLHVNVGYSAEKKRKKKGKKERKDAKVFFFLFSGKFDKLGCENANEDATRYHTENKNR